MTLAAEASPHPLDAIDRQIVLSLEQVTSPGEADITQAARLIIRHEDSKCSGDLFPRLRSVAQRWGYTRDSLMQVSKDIWQSGYRPVMTEDIVVQGVGSGADVEG